MILAICILIALFAASKGAGALPALLMTMPFLLLGNYLRLVGIQITAIVVIVAIFLFVRQIWFKTT
jgi:hypothetical protein